MKTTFSIDAKKYATALAKTKTAQTNDEKKQSLEKSCETAV